MPPTPPSGDFDQSEILRQACEEAFAAISSGIIHDTELARPLDRLGLHVELDLSFNAQVMSGPAASSAEVEINDGLLSDLFDSLDSNDLPLMAAVLWPMEEGDDPLFLPPQSVLETLFELSVHFVLHHELFHVLCGHLDLDRAVSLHGGRRILSERLSHLTMDRGKASPNDRLRAYFLELEADASAIEWMLERLSFTSLLHHLETLGWDVGSQGQWPGTLAGLRGRSRILAFRFLITAVWIVIALMEANRDGADFGTHPLPAARLIAAIKTAMVWFCSTGDLSLLPNGEMHWKLSDADLPVIDTFLHQVVRPVLTNLQDFPDPETAASLALPSGDQRSNHAVALFDDIARLLANQPPHGAGARQLKRVEALRIEMMQELSSFRYLEELKEVETGTVDNQSSS